MKGSDVGNSILKEEDVLKIIELCNQGLFEKDIAKIFNVNRGTVHAIKRGKLWSHITGIEYDENIFKDKRAKLQSGEVGVKWSEGKQRWIVVLKGKHVGTYKTLEVTEGEVGVCGRCRQQSRVNYKEIPKELRVFSGRSIELDEDTDMESLKELVRIVEEFDKTCDEIV